MIPSRALAGIEAADIEARFIGSSFNAAILASYDPRVSLPALMLVQEDTRMFIVLIASHEQLYDVRNWANLQITWSTFGKEVRSLSSNTHPDGG